MLRSSYSDARHQQAMWVTNNTGYDAQDRGLQPGARRGARGAGRRPRQHGQGGPRAPAGGRQCSWRWNGERQPFRPGPNDARFRLARRPSPRARRAARPDHATDRKHWPCGTGIWWTWAPNSPVACGGTRRASCLILCAVSCVASSHYRALSQLMLLQGVRGPECQRA